MARILILREAEAGRRTGELVRAGGDEPLLLPLQSIEPLFPVPPKGPFGAILVTSANAVPFLQANPLPHRVLAVGPASAEALRAAGFDADIAPEGTGAGLARPAAALHAETSLPLLYLAGRVRTDALENALRERGVPFETLEVYDTSPIEPDREDLDAALGGQTPDAVLIASLGQASAFERLLARFASRFEPRPLALCLSARIGRALPRELQRDSIVSERPELSELLDRYRRVREMQP